MKGIPEKYHATAAVSLVLLFIVVLLFATSFTASMIAAKKSEVEARQTQLEALKRRAAQPKPLPGAPVQTVEPLFAEGFALAANELQQRIVGLIENAGGTLVTVGIDPQVTADDDSGRRVAVQVVAEVSNDSLQEVLYELEKAAPFVFVESLQVSRVVTRGSGEGEQTPTSPRLSVDLRATGYFRKAAS
jgi:hypothetical protein